MSFYNWLTFISATLVTVLIIFTQTRGASVGAGIGGAAEVNLTRRGTEKTLFQLTIICAIVFTLSLVLGALA